MSDAIQEAERWAEAREVAWSDLLDAAEDVLRWRDKLQAGLNPPNYCPPLERLASAVRAVARP